MGSTYLAPYNSYHAMYLLPREVAAQVVGDARWLASESDAPVRAHGTRTPSPHGFGFSIRRHRARQAHIPPWTCLNPRIM